MLGHDTTSASMAWTLWLIATYHKVQATLHEEIDHVLGEGKEVTSEMLSELKYLDIVLKESLRVYPSVPFVQRELTEDVVLDGETIPAGTMVEVNINILHRNPKYWEDPEEFKPERWENETEEKDPYLYIPFSAGYEASPPPFPAASGCFMIFFFLSFFFLKFSPRNCIGQKFAQNEEKVIISKILQKFTMTAVDKHVPAIPELILRPEAVKIIFKRRN